MLKFSFTVSLLIIYLINQYDNHSVQRPHHVLKTGWYYLEDRKNDYPMQLDKSDENYYINPNSIVLAKHFSKVGLEDIKYEGKANQFVLIQFDALGTDAWSRATAKAFHKKLALIIDNRLVYVPQVNAQITSGVSALNRGNYSKKELQEFVDIIRKEM
ncbi:hypothetical protein BH09BAC6_BH09BAC6_15860 [soil metagenome]|jgi:preprotein translocase subunit SecD